MRRRALASVFVLAIGCGDATAPDVDGGADAGAAASDASMSIVVAAPVLTPCALGWREVAEGELVTCDPWPASGRASCAAADEAHFPGEPGCTRVGTACPSGDFAEDIPTTGVVLHVLAGAPVGGDGTRTRPFARIADAMSGAPPGAVIALGKGDYDEAVTMAASVTLWGACVAETTLHSSVRTDLSGVIEAGGSDAIVRNLRVVASPRPGVLVARRRLVLEDVVIENVTRVGVVALVSSQIEARNLVVRDTQPTPTGEFGIGVDVEGGSITIMRGTLERNVLNAVLVSGAMSSARFEDVAIDDTRPRVGAGDFGRGLNVQLGARFDGARLVFERSHDNALFVGGAGASASLTDVIVRDTQPRDGDGAAGRGLELREGAFVELRRAVLERNHEVAVFAYGADTHVIAEDVLIRDTLARVSDGLGGEALQAGTDATVELSRVHIARSSNLGLSCHGATITLTDVAVVDARELGCAMTTCVDRAFGVGIGAYSRGTITANGFRVERATLCGIQLAGGSQMDLRRGNVSGSQIGACVQVDGYDLARLSNEVSYRDNTRGLETTTLPEPSAVSPL